MHAEICSLSKGKGLRFFALWVSNVSLTSARQLVEDIFYVNNDTLFCLSDIVERTVPGKVATVQRMDTNRIPKQALQYKSKGRRDIGRPRKRWRDQLHFEDQGTGNMMKPNKNLMMMMMILLKAEFFEHLIIGNTLYLIYGKEVISVFLWKIKQY